MYLKGVCAPCNELISTSTDISVFHSMFQKTVGPVRCWDGEQDAVVKKVWEMPLLESLRAYEHKKSVKKSHSVFKTAFSNIMIMGTFKTM